MASLTSFHAPQQQLTPITSFTARMHHALPYGIIKQCSYPAAAKIYSVRFRHQEQWAQQPHNFQLHCSVGDNLQQWAVTAVGRRRPNRAAAWSWKLLVINRCNWPRLRVSWRPCNRSS